jgi:hypothetical protein
VNQDEIVALLDADVKEVELDAPRGWMETLQRNG